MHTLRSLTFYTTMTIKVQNTIDAISEWLTNVGASVLPQVSIPPQSGIGRLMAGAFGIDLASYNVWNELGFLLAPTIKSVIAPKLNSLLSNIPEEGYNEAVISIVDSAIAKAHTDGYVNIFGIQLGENAFVGLKDILLQKLNA